MGYESKLYICKRINLGDGILYNDTLAAINMSKMGEDFRHLFDDRLDGDFYGMDDDMSRFVARPDSEEDVPELVDNYGEWLRYTSLDKVLDWCNTYMDETDEFPYWRIAVLQETLSSIKQHFKALRNKQLIIVHYGY